MRRFARRLRDDRGVALIEFAISIPVLLTIGLVGLEVASYALAHLRVSNIAVLTADNASRIRDKIDEADVKELFIGAMQAGEGIKFEQNGRIILSALEQQEGNTARQWIRWQRCDGDRTDKSSYGKPLDKNGAAIVNGTEAFKADGTASSNPSVETKQTMTAMGDAGNQIKAQAGTAVMVAEVVYKYQPIVSDKLLGPLEIRYLSAFNVRQRTDQVLYNGAKQSAMSCG